jgi:putative Ca2+/H+ antiporter (TMEM165/GDT1 family)
MIFLAEFGDKTQIAIAGLGSTANATATWAGATLALACTSILGVAGRRLLHRLPLRWIQRISGAFFLLLALLAVLHLISTI